MAVGEIIRLVHTVVWLVVAVLLAIIYRKEIPKLFQAFGTKVSKLTAVGITLEFTAARPAVETLREPKQYSRRQ